MALQFTVDDIATVPEALRGEYTERDGKFHLNVDGAVPKARLDEFRNTNITTRKELDALKAQFDGVDVETYRTLTEQAAKLKEKKLIEAGKVEELFTERLTPMKAAHEAALAALTAKEAAATRRLEALLVDDKLKDEGVKAGVAPTGMRDFVSRGREVFRLHEGNSTAFDGDKPLFGKDGEPLKMSEWAGSLAAEAPHLFVASTGGGAPKGGSPVPNGSNTVTRAVYDATPPMDRAALVKGKQLVD